MQTPSANGFLLTVKTRSGGSFDLPAHWAAPFFVLIDNTDKSDQKPLLYHANDRADAERFRNVASDGRAFIFDADFTLVETK